mmetsp:Transcript_55273/g.108121  ORF Transcript_55273/g.108121 Transcript_55273/m.108121 type:complete len:220 (+) Transcript_55273:1036-1695(+)
MPYRELPPAVAPSVGHLPLSLLQVLDRRHSPHSKPGVEHPEGGHKGAQEGSKHKGNHKGEVTPCTALTGRHAEEILQKEQRDQVQSQGRIRKQQVEKFVVAPSHTVVDPGAVVIHSEHALLAEAAVVAPVGLVLHAPLAPPSLACALLLLCLEVGGSCGIDDPLPPLSCPPGSVGNRPCRSLDGPNEGPDDHQSRQVEHQTLNKPSPCDDVIHPVPVLI